MDWVKKNLLLVVSGVVALVLLSVAGYYLWSKHSLEAQVTESLASQTSELNQLSNSDPHPGNEKVKNIEAAKEQDKKLQEFVGEARKTFVPISYPTNLDSGQLKLLLDTVIDEMQRKADGMGVKLQPQYAFTFGSQRSQMSFDQKDILPLARMVVDIKTVVLDLFEARVLTLDGIRRCTVSSLDTPSPDFWNKKPTTNDTFGAVLTPYEFTFHCFTSELNRVVEGLYRSPHAFLLKSIVVDTSPSSLLERTEDGAGEPTMPMMMPGMNPMQLQMLMQMQRYGMRGMRYATPPPQEVPSPAARGGLTTLLDEKPFRAVLWVESVRLLDPEEIKAAKASARTSRPVRPAPVEGAEAADPNAAPAETPAEGAPAQEPTP